MFDLMGRIATFIDAQFSVSSRFFTFASLKSKQANVEIRKKM